MQHNINNIIRQVALDLLVGAVRNEDSRVRRELVELFWDLQYIYRFGVPRVPSPDIPLPVPSILQLALDSSERIQLHQEVLLGLLDEIAGDPSPQPSLQNILYDQQVRLAAAKGLNQRLEFALKQVNQEIERLEKNV